MNKIYDIVRREPVRIYNVSVAVAAVIAYFVTDFPVQMLLGAIAAFLGLGEMTRAAVTPNEKVVTTTDDLREIRRFDDDTPID